MTREALNHDPDALENLWRWDFDSGETIAAIKAAVPDFKAFKEWAAGEGYDVAYTHDGIKWICLNPMTADLWKTWQAATPPAVQPADKDAEIARLTACLKAANANAEKFEREWYLRGDEIEAMQAQPEPVAWYDKIMGVEVSMDVSTGEDDIFHRVFGRVYEVMLESGGAQNDTILAIEDSRNFTSPPKRQPLTDEQIEEIVDAHTSDDGQGYDIWCDGRGVARAIELHHGIGDKT
jgi:hypothetical protein